MSQSRLVLLIASLLITAGCAKNGAFTSSEYRPTAGASAGYLVGSFAAVASGGGAVSLDSNQLLFRAVGTEKKAGAIGMAANKTNFFTLKRSVEGDIQEGSREIQFYSIPLKPGRYEFFDVYYYEALGSGGVRYFAKQKFSIPFVIEPGKAHYVGEMRVERVTGDNLFGFTITTGATMARYNKRERDEAQLRSRFPEIANTSFEELQFEALAPPLVVDGRRFDDFRRGDITEQSNQLRTAEGNDLRVLGSQLVQANNYDPDLLEIAAGRISRDHGTDNERTADGLAHLAKLIGNSGETRYLPVLRQAAENAQVSGLRRHSAKAVRKLEASYGG